MPRKTKVKIVVMHDEKILLILRHNVPTISYPNTWNTPGGEIEEGESPQEAIMRVLKEELRLTPSTVVNTGITTSTDGSMIHRFFAPVTHQECATLHLNNKEQRMEWFTYIDLLALNESPYAFGDYTIHEQDIRQALAVKRKPAAQ